MTAIFGDATAYETYVGRWSRLAGQQFISWLNAPHDQRWLDFGSGTGILTQVILEQAAPRHIVGIDPTETFVERARQQVQDQHVEFIVGDASTLDATSMEFDAAAAGLVLNFLPSPPDALHSIAQHIRPGGVIGAYVWDYGGRMDMMRHFWDAAIAIDPAAANFDAGKHPMGNPDNLRTLYEQTGLHTVETSPLDVDAHFTSFDDFWLPFLSAQGSISKYLRSLDQPAVNRLSEQLRRQVPINADGTIDLIARAWAVKGTK